MPLHFAAGPDGNVAVDAHVAMPNHIHAIVVIHEHARRGAVTAPDDVVAAPDAEAVTQKHANAPLSEGNEMQVGETEGVTQGWRRGGLGDPDAPPNRFNQG